MGFGPPGFLHAPASKAVMAGVGLASLLVRASHLSPSRVSLTPRAVLGVGAHGRQLISRLVLSNLAFTSVGESSSGSRCCIASRATPREDVAPIGTPRF
jgi:hypothetical protein